jgi:hypothetical protein
MKADRAVVKEALAGVHELPAMLSFSPSCVRIGRLCSDNDTRGSDGSSHASTWSRFSSPEIKHIRSSSPEVPYSCSSNPEVTHTNLYVNH